MMTTRHMTLEAEMIRWLLLVVAAVALVLAVATLLAANPLAEPRLLPTDMGEVAKPLAMAPARPFFPEDPPARAMPAAETAARIWMTLDQQRAGCVAEALAGWEQIRLPEEAAHWREIARAAAYLRAGDVNRALRHLDEAAQLEPGHAVVAYYRGIVRLEQAAAAVRVPDAMNGERMRLVAFTPQEDKAVYELMAIDELHAAIAGAGFVRLDQRLLHTDMALEEEILVPRVGDLLAALGADNFVGKAHHLLFGLYMERGEWIDAETQLDLAAANGMRTLYGYRDLAELHLDRGQNAAAARVLQKDLGINHPWVGKGYERLNEMAYAALKGMWVW